MEKKQIRNNVKNVEKSSIDDSYITVTTCLGKNGRLYYVIHIGNRDRSGSWKNQFMFVSSKDLPVLEMLIRKSWFFSSTLGGF